MIKIGLLAKHQTLPSMHDTSYCAVLTKIINTYCEEDDECSYRNDLDDEEQFDLVCSILRGLKIDRHIPVFHLQDSRPIDWIRQLELMYKKENEKYD